MRFSTSTLFCRPTTLHNINNDQHPPEILADPAFDIILIWIVNKAVWLRANRRNSRKGIREGNGQWRACLRRRNTETSYGTHASLEPVAFLSNLLAYRQHGLPSLPRIKNESPPTNSARYVTNHVPTLLAVSNVETTAQPCEWRIHKWACSVPVASKISCESSERYRMSTGRSSKNQDIANLQNACQV